MAGFSFKTMLAAVAKRNPFRNLKAEEIDVFIATNLDNEVTLGEDILIKGWLSGKFKSVTLVDVRNLPEQIATYNKKSSVILYGNVAEFENDAERQKAIKATREADELAKKRRILFLSPLDSDTGRTGNKNYLREWNLKSQFTINDAIPVTASSLDELDTMLLKRDMDKPVSYVVKSVTCEASNTPMEEGKAEQEKGFHIFTREQAEKFLAAAPEGAFVVQPFVQPYSNVSFFLIDGKVVLQQETEPYEPEKHPELYDPATANSEESRQERFRKRWETLRVVENPLDEECQIAIEMAEKHNPDWNKGIRRIDFKRDKNGKLIFGKQTLDSIEPVPSWALDAEGMIVKDMNHPIGIIKTGEITDEFKRLASQPGKRGKMYDVVDAIEDCIVANANRNRMANFWRLGF
jgi:hypothetical protein